MADMIISVDYDITKAEAKQNKLNREFEISQKETEIIKDKINDTKKAIDAESKAQAEITDELKAQINEAADLEIQLERIKSGNASAQEIINFGSISEAENRLQEMYSSIQKNEQSFDKSANTSKKLNSELQKQNLLLDKQKAKTSSIGDRIKLNTDKSERHSLSWLKTNKNIKRSQTSMARFGRRLKELVKSALIFSVLTNALTALRESFGELLNKEGTKTAQLIAKLKGNLKTLGVTFYEGMRPYIEWLLQRLIEVTQILTNGLAKILGKNVKNMSNLAKSTEKTAKAAKKATASFDTLQTIDTSSDESNSSSGNSADFSAMDQPISETVARIGAIVSAAVLVIGMILTLTGANIPLGLGLIALGAIGLAGTVTEAWNSLDEPVQTAVAGIIAIISAAFLLLGVILAFTGANIPLGIGFIALGAVGLAKTYKEKWDTLDEPIKNTILTITAIVSAALLILGVILAFTGAAIPLGIGLIILGAAGLAATYATNWDTLPEETKNTVSTIMAIGGTLMIVLGLILILTGVGIPLGIGLLLVGAASIVGAIAFNWDSFTEKVKSIGGTIASIFSSVWEGIKNGFKAMVNGIISFANIWIDGLNALLWPIRALIVGIAKAFGSNITLDNVKIPHIPRLATGAVIPGGSPFLAMLGDQRRGQTNIEAPLDTLVEAFRQAREDTNVNVHFTGSLSQLGRVLQPVIVKENRRSTIF